MKRRSNYRNTRMPARAATRVKQSTMKVEKATKKYWKPEVVNQRFPTETDLMFGELQGRFQRVYSNAQMLEKAERWRGNYANSLRELMMNVSEANLGADVEDKLDQLYWEVLNMPVHTYLEAQDTYPNELSIRVNYLKLDLALNVQRILERWSKFV